MYLYYTKANFSDKRAVDGISIYSVGDINEHKSGAINCYYKDGTLHEAEISLNKGVSNTPYVYMHINTVTKTNRPSTDPVMASGLVYNGNEQLLVSSMGTTYDNTYKMWFREIGQNQYLYEGTYLFTKATNAGTYNVEYYAGSSTYGDKSETKIHQVTIAKSPNNGVTVSCSNYLEGTAPVPSLVGNNLSTGTITYKYSTSQNGTYTTNVPSEPGTHWVKATIAGDGNCYDYTTAPVSFTITYNWKLHNSGDTEDDAYVISTTTDLKYLAVWVNLGNNFEGKFFKLGANITLDKSKENNFTPIGNANYSFSGTFDGQGYTISGLNINKPNNNNVGLFGRANNATIKNLKLDNCTITNCRVTNSVTVSGTSYVGGIVGQNANVIGCASEAAVSGSSNYVGGIIGNSNSYTIANSLYTGTSVSCSGNNKGAIVGSNTNTTLTVNYYTANLASKGCKGSDINGARKAVAINTADAVTVTPTGTATSYNISGITGYAGNNGIGYGGHLYAGATETVSLDITYAIDGFSVTGYTDGVGSPATDLTLVSDNTYTLVMPATTATVTPVGNDLWGITTAGRDGSAEHPYIITTTEGLDLLASKVNSGTNYAGKYFELGNDIDYSEVPLTLDDGKSNYTAIGYNYAYNNKSLFSGHFDGKGHTISGIVINKAANCQGLFSGIDGAEVKNLTITDATIPYTYSGFVWQTSGTGMFSDSLSLRPVYYPSEADFEAGEVTLTLRVSANGTLKTDAMQLQLYKALSVFAGDDGFSGLDRPLPLDQAEAYNYDSLRWHSMGDGRFDDSLSLHPVYYPGAFDKEQGFVELMLEAWSFCGYASDVVRFELFKDYALEGRTWSNGVPQPNTQVIAAALSNDNPFVSGFYRTVSDSLGFYRFDALLPDTYTLYAFPDTLYATSSGCYYLGDLQWNESNMVEVDGDVYDVDIALPAKEQGFNTGNGSISGMFDYPESDFRARDFYCQPWLREGEDVDYCTDGLSNVGVLLLNSTKQRIVGFALTRNDGGFRFSGLPFGTYHLMADLPRYGRGMCEEITLSVEQPSVTDLHLFVSEEGRVDMRRSVDVDSPSDLLVYPNPAEERVSVGGLKINEEYKVCVLNGLGMMVLPETTAQTNLLGEISLPVNELRAGLYFIQVKGQSTSVTTKFVKR